MKGFFSYAHDDIDLFVQFRKHLAATKQAIEIACWADQSLQAGNRRAATIRRAIDEARLFILLSSPAYIDTRYILEQWRYQRSPQE